MRTVRFSGRLGSVCLRSRGGRVVTAGCTPYWADTIHPEQTPLLGRYLPWAEPWADTPLGRHPLGRHPPEQTPPDRHPLGRHPPGRHPWGRHFSLGRHPPPWEDTHPPKQTPPRPTPPAQFMLGYTPSPAQCMLGYTTPPEDRILDTRLWKHCLSATSFADGKD